VRLRQLSLLFGAALVVCLVADSSARLVGDGAEYLAMATNFASLRGPALAPADLPRTEEAVAAADGRFARWDAAASTIAARDRRRDFVHFWFYPLLAAPFVWTTRAVGASPLYAFTLLNGLLLLAALHVALPRIGGAACLLLFAGPAIWWIDKAHTEIFTFSLLAIAFLVMRDRPWWSMVAAGAAAAQNPPIAIVMVLTAAGGLFGRQGSVRDGRFLRGAAIGFVLCLLQPAYTYARHGTVTLLALQNPGHVPAWAEVIAVPFDPAIGLVANFPALAVAIAGAAIVCLRADRRPAIQIDIIIALASAATFTLAFAQATNVHHGGTPGMSRYGLWLVPLAVPLFARAHECGRAGYKRFAWGLAAASALVCIFLFRPSAGENSREPTMLAQYLWTRHPAWNNPLPEVFAESWVHRDERWAPISTRGCDKILLMAVDGQSAFPIPCLPAPLPPECAAAGTLCYANRDGSRYRFARAPGSAIQLTGFQFAADSVWPAGSDAHVRDLLVQAGWPALTPRPSGESAVRLAQGLRVTELSGTDRLVFVIRDVRPGARMVLRLPSTMRGILADGMTGEIADRISYQGPPLELWPVAVPARSRLLLLLLWRA